ncbi:SET domain-containing protein [Guyanagaster necrorhizus]|uniref:SET domain-containing protein n=1 Tax=Guyanagaster necrorhizus TaxID=856835 RepID=A0A9P7VHV0_9AGAR|nr:SET domain-containing protein [Guyanagaster necrorhizus MCA 3950]KAG7440655.1 SET domain-containing protein [Guyanagaster necrorhizus MCA 3950]
MSDPILGLLKTKASEAFKQGDFTTARSLYSHSVDIDPQDDTHPLNRSLMNLRLTRWSDAEEDATKALALCQCTKNDHKQKAYYRRCQARREMGDIVGAQNDLKAFASTGGARDLVDAEQKKIDSSITTPQLVPAHQSLLLESKSAPSERTYFIDDAGNKGLGAFAARDIHRGDLILTEKPLLPFPHNSPSRTELRLAMDNLSPTDLLVFLSLKNTRPDRGDTIDGIYKTNAFANGGIVIEASRFNHSCRPNARYSYHEATNRQRIFALTYIPEGEEIFVSYLASRNVYGATRNQRQAALRAKQNFLCSCAACGLDRQLSLESDRRRTEIRSIWDRMPTFNPRTDGRAYLQIVVRAINLMKEEGYWADADDFANEAAALCSMHADWESAKYWHGIVYETRVAEFGKDSAHTFKARRDFEDPRSIDHPYAGVFHGQTFADIRL